MTHVPKTFAPALPLGRDEQGSLIRFLAGRETCPAGQNEWNGAFAAVAALRQPTGSKE